VETLVYVYSMSNEQNNTNDNDMDYSIYKKSERGFTKHNKDAKFQKNLQTHHIARLYMMMQEERGRMITYEQALEETDY